MRAFLHSSKAQCPHVPPSWDKNISCWYVLHSDRPFSDFCSAKVILANSGVWSYSRGTWEGWAAGCDFIGCARIPMVLRKDWSCKTSAKHTFCVLFVTISVHLDAFRFMFHAILWSKVWKWGHRWWRTDTSIKQYCPKRAQLSVEAVKQDIRSLSSAFCFLFSPEGTTLPVLTTTLCRISGYPEGHLTIQLLQGDLIHCFAFSGFSWPHAGPQIKDWCKHFCSNRVM